jgi:hypothetical protein
VVDVTGVSGATVTIANPTGTPPAGAPVYRFRVTLSGTVTTWAVGTNISIGTDIVLTDLPTASGAKFEFTLSYNAVSGKYRLNGATRGYTD